MTPNGKEIGNSMITRKTFGITEDNIETLKKIRMEKGFTTDSQVINYLLSKERNPSEKQIAIAVRKELEKNYIQSQRLRWSTQIAEQNSIIILDILNTWLQKNDIGDCISVEFAAAPVIEQSRNIIRERVAYFKQKSDERKSIHSGIKD